MEWLHNLFPHVDNTTPSSRVTSLPPNWRSQLHNHRACWSNTHSPPVGILSPACCSTMLSFSQTTRSPTGQSRQHNHRLVAGVWLPVAVVEWGSPSAHVGNTTFSSHPTSQSPTWRDQPSNRREAVASSWVWWLGSLCLRCDNTRLSSRRTNPSPNSQSRLHNRTAGEAALVALLGQALDKPSVRFDSTKPSWATTSLVPNC